MSILSAEIISIGNELLSGLTINTNAAFIGKKLTAVGVEVTRITTIPDTPQDIRNVLNSIAADSKVIIITGGLGPTPDDITKKVVADYFNTDLILHEPSLKRIKKIFEGRGMTMPDINRDQAMIPSIANVIPNKYGTAPGIEIEFNEQVFYFLPGVPYEMKMLIEDHVLGRIVKKYNPGSADVHVFRTNGLAESKLFEILRDVLEDAETFFNIAFLPNTSGVELRLKSKPEKKPAIDYIAQIRNIISDFTYSDKQETLSQVIGRILIEKNYTLAVAESFTGGTLSDWISDVPGCSQYFMGSIISYSNQSKNDFLHVPQEILKEHGAVSAETVEKMVRGVQARFNTDCALASTGIAGPGGATEDKPIGLCYLAAMVRDRILVRKFNFGKDRRTNKERGASAGLEMLRQLLIE